MDLEKLIEECSFSIQDKGFIRDVMLGKEDYYYTVEKEKVKEIVEIEKYIDDKKTITTQEIEVIRFKDEKYDEEAYEEFNKKLDDICKRIKEQNDYNWKTCIEVSGKVKIPQDVNYKQCRTCRKDLIYDNFGNDERNKDGKKSICKKCDSYTKKIRKNG